MGSEKVKWLPKKYRIFLTPKLLAVVFCFVLFSPQITQVDSLISSCFFGTRVLFNGELHSGKVNQNACKHVSVKRDFQVDIVE